MSKKFLRKQSVAERYDVDERTVDRMKDDGRLPAPHYRGRLPMWDEDELDASDRAAAVARPSKATGSAAARIRYSTPRQGKAPDP